MVQHIRNSLAHLPPNPMGQQVTLGVLHGRHRKEMIELIARLALRGPFHFIVGGDWIPDQGSLRRAVRSYTTHVNDVLDRPKLGRPSTCLQLLDQLTIADTQQDPIFIIDFLDRFYDPDVNLALRQRTLEGCCQSVKILSKTKSVFILTKYLPTDDYQVFFPVLEAVADEILELSEHLPLSAVQHSLL